MSVAMIPSPKSILIIDDDINQRRSLALVLKSVNYMVNTVGKAGEAIENLKAEKYDLIILDIATIDTKINLLPTVKGLYPEVPILVFTAQWSPETAAEIEQIGISAHLSKPITPSALLDCVDLILREQKLN